EPFEGTGDAPLAVAGFFLPDPQNAFEMAMAATVLPRRCEIDARTFLPSSRSVAFSKAAWQAAGGYPEWLDYCEDVVFDLALRERSAMAFAPQALVYFRPRGSLGAFFKQYYRYARGDGKADLWRARHAIRYLTYLVAAPLLFVLGHRKSPIGWLFLGASAAAYCRRPLLRLFPYFERLSSMERLYAIALIPLIRLVGDCAKMLGYPVGLWWRLTRRQ
ncbi:MAG TPA: glycosyl transferase, partial [Chloroflexota bacterium]|nr:glycosyl transferase [Chloroflexota bacterium]